MFLCHQYRTRERSKSEPKKKKKKKKKNKDSTYIINGQGATTFWGFRKDMSIHDFLEQYGETTSDYSDYAYDLKTLQKVGKVWAHIGENSCKKFDFVKNDGLILFSFWDVDDLRPDGLGVSMKFMPFITENATESIGVYKYKLYRARILRERKGQTIWKNTFRELKEQTQFTHYDWMRFKKTKIEIQIQTCSLDMESIPHLSSFT